MERGLVFDLSEERLLWCEPIPQRGVQWYGILCGGRGGRDNYVRPQCNADWKL